MNTKKTFQLLLAIILITYSQINPQGKVYLVLGSDTAIWDGMLVSKYHCYYNLNLFTSPSSNTATVMSDAFRDQLTDSYGNKLKMTWWMIGGNMFRYALNNNVPVDNTMALHLMKKYYGDKITQWGDELSLHYHTFFWSDYDGDGIYWWNQSKTFNETREDFDITLAQFLIEENVFPISFRSGWHFMDNDWQNYLNELLPYSLHNDWPAKRTDNEEPTDNNFDWSLASSEFVPFHPSEENYQLPGNTKGWNVRSKYMGYSTLEMMNDIFAKANQGKDQLVCFWSHLPDQNFLNEIQQVNDLAHQAALKYPDVKFQYCTSIEAYELYRKTSDTIKPQITITSEINGANIFYMIKTNEPIFQKQPFVVVKDRYEQYHIMKCDMTASNLWRTSDPFPINNLAKFGVALSDTLGNLSTSFINYLPDDLFIDNSDTDYLEVKGDWNSSSITAWGLDSRFSNINPGDSSKVQWNFKSEYNGYYNFFTQFPSLSDQIDSVKFNLFVNNQEADKQIFIKTTNYNQWEFISTLNLNEGDEVLIEMSAKNNKQSTKVLAADVLKVSAFVRDKQIVPEKLVIDIGDLSIDDTLTFNFKITNMGINTLTLNNVISKNGSLVSLNSFPIKANGMEDKILEFRFIPSAIGPVSDTLIIISDDPINSKTKIAFEVNVTNYFKVTDNEFYAEYVESGSWFTSVVQAYGNSSRYAYIQNTFNGPTATFTTKLNHDGIYDLYELIPTTVNSADNALYEISSGSLILDSIYLNQNEGSGKWKLIGRYNLQSNLPVSVKVIDSGESTSGPVIRADAFKFLLIEEITGIDKSVDNNQPKEFILNQNYPNPFNPSTIISWESPIGSWQTLKIYDILGKEVAVLVNEFMPAGKHEIEFKISELNQQLSSGIYIYQLKAGNYTQLKKMVYMK